MRTDDAVRSSRVFWDGTILRLANCARELEAILAEMDRLERRSLTVQDRDIIRGADDAAALLSGVLAGLTGTRPTERRAPPAIGRTARSPCPPDARAPNGCDSLRVMVIEDDYVIAADVADTLRRENAEIIGPVSTIEGAIDLLQRTPDMHGALLDVNLRGTMAFEVADRLLAARVPFVFATGYDRAVIPPRFSDVRLWQKPVDVAGIRSILSDWSLQRTEAA